MKRFAFRASDEDRSYITELAQNGMRVTVNIDPCQGGILLADEDASLTWSWRDEFEVRGISGADADEEGDLVSHSTGKLGSRLNRSLFTEIRLEPEPGYINTDQLATMVKAFMAEHWQLIAINLPTRTLRGPGI